MTVVVVHEGGGWNSGGMVQRGDPFSFADKFGIHWNIGKVMSYVHKLLEWR